MKGTYANCVTVRMITVIGYLCSIFKNTRILKLGFLIEYKTEKKNCISNLHLIDHKNNISVMKVLTNDG